MNEVVEDDMTLSLPVVVVLVLASPLLSLPSVSPRILRASAVFRNSVDKNGVNSKIQQSYYTVSKIIGGVFSGQSQCNLLISHLYQQIFDNVIRQSTLNLMQVSKIVTIFLAEIKFLGLTAGKE